MKHSDYCTHINNDEDKDILTRPLFDVNMRLFKTSDGYRKIVISVCNYLKWWAETPKDGYKIPHGVSGANAAIPFNIIAYNVFKDKLNCRKCGGKGRVYEQFFTGMEEVDCDECKTKATVLINPRIIKYHGELIQTNSNCGSLTLDKPILVNRYERVSVEFWDMKGNFHRQMFNRDEGSLTIQHEIDHNQGILITDRKA